VNILQGRRRILVVGMSVAGVRAAEELRRQRWDGDLTIIGAESHFPPIDRPALSKDLLAGRVSVDEARLAVKPLDATLLLNRLAVGLDLERRAVRLSDDSEVEFDDLVIASGTVPRLLPIGDSIQGVYLLRTVEDCLALRDTLGDDEHVVIVGAGFVGCEVAATCHELGMNVTVIEPQPTPLKRAFGPNAGELVGELHRSRGVDLRTGVSVMDVLSTTDAQGVVRVSGVALSNGSEIPCSRLVVAIGVVPSTDWLEGSGLKIENGVVLDETCAALGAEGVVAAGDVARWKHPIFNRLIRVEHWTNALEQGRHAARRLLTPSGVEPKPFEAIPYYWSNQYEHMIQFVGVPGGEESGVEVLDGGGKAVLYREEGQLVGALILDAPRLITSYRKRILAEHAEAFGRSQGSLA
jgi:NADPH-dependent 2,4-dienoyl-CoA reductase/sulfur reductase-like enzyme